MAINQAKLDTYFSHRKAKKGDTAKRKLIRSKAKDFANAVFVNTPAGVDRDVAIRKIREAVWTAFGGLACHEPVNGAARR